MNLKSFKSGKLVERAGYRSFEPTPVNVPWSWDDSELNFLIEKSSKLLGELNAFSYIVPDIDLFISMHKLKEAAKSGKIEGTKTEIGEALLPVDDIDDEKRDDWNEVQNYIKAMNAAIEMMNDLPISNRLLKETHKVLMQGVRGEKKTPGEFRKSQNWIGGTKPSDAAYVPPHWESLTTLMSDLEKFANNRDAKVPHIVKNAIIHYQFETIHPFLDGNGRIGRLPVILYFLSEKILNKPSLYLSDYFEKRRTEYYDSLTRVRTNDDLRNWVVFFINAVIAVCEKGVETFRTINSMKRANDKLISTFGRKSENARVLFDELYKNPIIEAKKTARILAVSDRAARDLIKDFEEIGILKEYTGGKRYKKFVYREYLDLFYD